VFNFIFCYHTFGEIKLYILTPPSSVPCSNAVIGHWTLMGGLLHLVQRGRAWVGCGPDQSPEPRCTKCDTLPINGQCTNLYYSRWHL